MNTKRFKLLFQVYGLLVVALFSGCQRSDGGVEVTGLVTWNGQPIPAGMIVLEPTEQSNTTIGGKIQDGKYLLRAKPGKMRVQIEAVRRTQQRDPQSGTTIGEMYIPTRYNRESHLEANVTLDGNNTFDFALTN